jgi:hypothetical protein
MKSLKLIGKIIFLLFSIIYLLIPFIYVITTKINQPHLKNLNNKDIIYLGFILLISILINIKLFLPYFKKKSNS